MEYADTPRGVGGGGALLRGEREVEGEKSGSSFWGGEFLVGLFLQGWQNFEVALHDYACRRIRCPSEVFCSEAQFRCITIYVYDDSMLMK